MNDPKTIILEVQWALQEAYKMAVKLRGITDWTNDFHENDDRAIAQREVERYQIEIAKMILGRSRGGDRDE